MKKHLASRAKMRQTSEKLSNAPLIAHFRGESVRVEEKAPTGTRTTMSNQILSKHAYKLCLLPKQRTRFYA